jgi:hypothetical protein
MSVETDEQVRQGVQLGLVERRQPIGAADHDQSGDIVEDVDEHDRNGDQRAQDDHLPGEGLVDRFEQTVERQDQEDGDDLVDELAPDAESQKRLGSPEVLGRGGRVLRHDQLGGNV